AVVVDIAIRVAGRLAGVVVVAKDLRDIEEVHGAVGVGVAGQQRDDQHLARRDVDAGVLGALVRAVRIADGVLGGIALRQAAGQARAAPILVGGVGVDQVAANHGRGGGGEQIVVGKIKRAVALNRERRSGVGDAGGVVRDDHRAGVSHEDQGLLE